MRQAWKRAPQRSSAAWRIAGDHRGREEALDRKRQDDVELATGGKRRLGDEDVGAGSEAAVDGARALGRQRGGDLGPQRLLEVRLRLAVEVAERAAAIDRDAADRQAGKDLVDRHGGMSANAAKLKARRGEPAVGGVRFPGRGREGAERRLLLAEQQMGLAERGVCPVALARLAELGQNLAGERRRALSLAGNGGHHGGIDAGIGAAGGGKDGLVEVGGDRGVFLPAASLARWRRPSPCGRAPRSPRCPRPASAAAPRRHRPERQHRRARCRRRRAGPARSPG